MTLNKDHLAQQYAKGLAAWVRAMGNKTPQASEPSVDARRLRSNRGDAS